MSWAQENKFLTGVIAVTVIGAGVLGYLLYDAMGRNSVATEEFDRLATEKKRLESLPVYPNEANLRKLQEQKQEHLGRIQELQKKLNSMEVPEEPLTPEQFQDRLRASVTAYVTKAAEVRMKLPEKFYMGFDAYQTTPPKAEAAPKLGKQLKSVEFVLAQIATSGASELRNVIREELPEEGGKTKAAAPPPPKPGAPTAPGAKKLGAEVPPLLQRHPFEVVFLSKQFGTQNVINAITKDKKQFYINRAVVVKNEKQEPPVREVVAPPVIGDTPPADAPAAPPADPNNPTAPPAPPAPGPAPAPAPAPTPAPPTQPGQPAQPGFQFIVGEENVETTILVEVAEFADAPQAPADAKGGNKPK